MGREGIGIINEGEQPHDTIYGVLLFIGLNNYSLAVSKGRDYVAVRLNYFAIFAQ
jgi:hypothetical protein